MLGARSLPGTAKGARIGTAFGRQAFITPLDKRPVTARAFAPALLLLKLDSVFYDSVAPMYLMPFSLTTAQIDARTKTVTRRLGWLRLKEGDAVCAVDRCMGLRKGQTVRRLAVLRIDTIVREPLRRMLDEPDYGQQECLREGFGPGTSCPGPSEFVDFFCRSHMGCTPETTITRIAFSFQQRPAQPEYEAEIRAWLNCGAGADSAELRMEQEMRAIGRYWAEGRPPYNVVSNLWPESLQLLLPGMAPQHQHEPQTFRPNLVGIPALSPA